jgi:diguanylate cyclase (GGDEF)-like protein
MTRTPISSSRSAPAATRSADEHALESQALEDIFQALPDIFFLLNADDHRILLFRAGDIDYLYRPPEAFLGKQPAQNLPDPIARRFDDTIERCKTSGDLESCEYELDVPRGRVTFEARFKLVPGRNHIVCLVRDVTSLHEARRQLEALAHRDQLTGLPNRTVLDSLLDSSLSRARRSDTRLAVMFIDLDRFKEVNDSLGHAAGDGLLQQASQRMQSLLRESDTLARVGGDEFVLILDDLSDTRDASRVASKLMQTLSAPFTLDAQEASVSCSIGISIFPDDATERAALLRYADTAMYEAKSSGRDAWRFYTAEMTVTAMRQLAVIEGLRRALAEGRLTQSYQPLVDLKSGTCVAFEALARWEDDALGEVSPAEFIPLGEQSGLARPLDLWALRTACTQLVSWLERGIAPDYVSVNLSNASLLHPEFAGTCAQVLTGIGLPGERLQIEVSESLLLRRESEVLANLKALTDLGVRLAVDNFGTGYAAIRDLRSLPIQTLKIDGSFIRAINGGGEEDSVIADAIISLGRAMHLSLVAAGIEEEPQAAFVRARKDILGQGYFLGMPLAAAEADRVLRQTRRAPAPAPPG